MSFSTEVKKEILSLEDRSKCCIRALVFGILVNSSEIRMGHTKKIIIKSTVLNTLKKVSPYLKETYNINIEIGQSKSDSKLFKNYYYLEIVEKVDEIIKDFSLMPFDPLDLHHDFLKKTCCKHAFVAGMFSSKGSISDPRKESYHLEITCKNESLSQVVFKILKNANIPAKIIERRNQIVLYVKKSESIRDFLSLIGANSGVFYFEDSRIYRDLANMANRVTNCDIANENKCARSCEKQLSAIAYLKKHNHFEKLSVRLQSIARLREEYPDSSLEELSIFSSNVFGKKLSKSGISHCMNDLITYYNFLINENKQL